MATPPKSSASTNGKPLAKLTAVMVAAALAAAAPFALPMISKWESSGKPALVPYRDIVGIWTVCDGETRVTMRRYTLAECKAMTVKAYNEFGPRVLACTPGIHNRPPTLAASVVVAYNIGSAGYCGSTMARRFNAGDIAGGCDAFLNWNKAGGRVVNGLTRRRQDERRLCLQGAS